MAQSKAQSSSVQNSGQGIRSGAQYLEGLRDGREIWTRGDRVDDVTREPGLARGAATLASFLARPAGEPITSGRPGRMVCLDVRRITRMPR